MFDPSRLRTALSAILAGLSLSTATAAPSGGFGATHEPEETRPNLLLFVSDDHRADMLGCADHPFLQTPNIDRLASAGVRHTNAFVTTSICAASRASILTGLVERSHRYTFGTPPLSSRRCRHSLPRLLRDAGYLTGYIGKFGVRIDGGSETLDSMYDRFIPLTQPYVRVAPDGSTQHLTDLIGDEAVAFVERAPLDRPYFLSIGFNAAHAVDGDLVNHFPPPPAEAELYRDIEMPRPRLDGDAAFEAEPAHLRDSMNRDRWFWRWDQPEKYDRNLRNHLRMITGLDRNIGKVLAAAARRGDLGNTVVVFLGDNGFYLGERGFAGKWSHHDESLRVPLVVCDFRRGDPGRGEISEPIALNIDVAPTLLAAAGVDPPPDMQGRVIAGVSGAEPTAAPEAFFCEHRMRHPRIPRWEGLRSDDWKYARYLDVPGTPEHLYDLAADPLERRDLAADPAHRARLEAMRAETSARSMAHREAGDPLPRVLLIGDSISMGYHSAVVRRLDDRAEVSRPRENCQGTTHGVARIEQWLEEAGDVDLIHFNFGLHDLKAVDDRGRNSNEPAAARQADLETYRTQLRAITQRIVATEARVIFATTTPVPAGGVRPHRDPEDVARYNLVAREVMEEFGVAILDLNAIAAAKLSDLQKPRDVHFTRTGSDTLGEAVASKIDEALRSASDDSRNR